MQRHKENTMPEHPPQRPWYHQLAHAFTQHMYLKGIGTMLFIAIFFGAYFYLLKQPAFPITVMPVTWLDRVIGFQPLAMPIYLSLWIYVSLPPALLASRRELFHYGVAISITCLAGLMVFFFWPTAVPTADIDWALHPNIHFLKSIDMAGNAFPSLHVATAVFSCIWLHHLLRRFYAPRWLMGLNVLWGFGIIYSTLATHQHVAVDVYGGILLGGVTATLSLRHQRSVRKVDNARPAAN